jgi:hypothetical protein
LVSRRRSLVGLRSPSKYVPPATSRRPKTPTPLLRSFPLQHIRDRRYASRGRDLPATFRPQGLTSLSAVSSLRARARHVSGRLHSWGSPFGAFLSRRAIRPLNRTAPTRRYPRTPPRSKPRGIRRGTGLWAFTPAEARCPKTGV